MIVLYMVCFEFEFVWFVVLKYYDFWVSLENCGLGKKGRLFVFFVFWVVLIILCDVMEKFEVFNRWMVSYFYEYVGNNLNFMDFKFICNYLIY